VARRRDFGLVACPLIADMEEDREMLYYKAVYEAVAHGMEMDHAVRLLHDLRLLLEKTLC